jgi:hypothetical protein
MLWMKYAGGCSMTESPNDLGAPHMIMHEQFSSPHFRYGDAIDPIGKPYEQLKEFLARYLDPSSFKTIWKFCCKSEEFVDRAFTISNVKSSFKSAGIFPRSDREILSKNPEFRKLSDGEAAFVLASIQGFSAKIDEKGYICESEFDQHFEAEENIDTAPAKTGMPLNEMATNRQRAMIDSHERWQSLQGERLELKRLEDEAKAARVAAKAEKLLRIEAKRIADLANNVLPPGVTFTNCGNGACEQRTPSKDKKPKGWMKCSGKNCRFWACGLLPCVNARLLHIEGCDRC